MKPNWVFDASPLIVLGKADLLSSVSPLAENWIIPEGVVKEVSRKGDIDLLLSKLSEDSRVERQTVAIEPLVANWNLGNGESEVITLAVKNSEYGVILDDLPALQGLFMITGMFLSFIINNPCSLVLSVAGISKLVFILYYKQSL
jgi:predicted nucleic acid-binding protein